MQNTEQFEQAVMARVVLSHLDRLCASWLHDGLKCPQDASDLGLGWSVSKCMQWRCFDIGAGDAFIVHDGRRLVMVHACLERNGALFVVAKLGSRLAQVSSTAWEWLVEKTFSVLEVDATWSTPALWYARAERDRWVVVEM